MHVVAVVNSKGGVGKTTIASALAVRAARESPRVAMVDLDPQRSLVEWWRRRGKTQNPTIFDGVDTAAEAVERLSQTGWDWVIVDSPPAFLRVIEEVIAAADLAVIPIRASILDLLATQDAVVLAQKVGTPFLCVLNDVNSRDKLADEARSTLFTAGMPIADTNISHRVSHVAAMTAGKSAAEVNGGKDKAAAAEIDALWLEVKAAVLAATKRKAKEATDGR